MLEPRTAPQPRPSDHKPLERWAATRLIQLACLSISFYLLVAASATPTSKLAVAIINPQSASQSPGPNRQVPDFANATVAQPALDHVTIRIGLWDFCIYGVTDGDDSTFCSRKFYLDPAKDSPSRLGGAYNSTMCCPPIDDHGADFLSSQVVHAVANNLQGLGQAMVAVPVACAFVGLTIVFMWFSFFSFGRPRCWRPHRIRDALLTNRCLGILVVGSCFVTTLVGWTISSCVVASSWDTLRTFKALTVSSVYTGGAHVLISVAAMLQMAAFAIQCSMYRTSPTQETASMPAQTSSPSPVPQADRPRAPSVVRDAESEKALGAKQEEALAEGLDHGFKDDAPTQRPPSYLPPYPGTPEGDVKNGQDVKADPDRKSATAFEV